MLSPVAAAAAAAGEYAATCCETRCSLHRVAVGCNSNLYVMPVAAMATAELKGAAGMIDSWVPGH